MTDRLAWARGLGLCSLAVEALTNLAEEAERREQAAVENGRTPGWWAPEADPRDPWGSWPEALRRAGYADLAREIEVFEAEHEGNWCCLSAAAGRSGPAY